jgi:deazaflavin-dependent oxidoreductase (nitroreductase family)
MFNRVAVRAAGARLLPVWAVVEHRGRRSGHRYTTPVAIAASTPEFVYIGLAWGPRTDWVRNLRAAGGGTLRWRGRSRAVAEPTIVDKDEALAAASSTARRFLSQRGPEQYLRLRT